MTQNKSLLLRTRLITAGIVCLSFTAMLISSCTKSSSSNNNNNNISSFVGTYNKVSNDCNGGNTFSLFAGSSSSQVTFPGDVGTGSCLKNFNVVCNTSGNNLTIPSQTFTDDCGTTVATISGSATLNGNTLSMTSNIGFNGSSVTCHFVGTK